VVVCTPHDPSPRAAQAQEGDHVFLIDGSSFIFRAYFAMFKAAQSRGRSFTRSDGKPMGAVLTFCNMLWKLLRGTAFALDIGADARINCIKVGPAWNRRVQHAVEDPILTGCRGVIRDARSMRNWP
jgi:hypothetical protein